MATIREIAREAGYSPATVSRVLNGDQTFSVSKKAKEQILKVAHELNYDHRLIKERGYSVAVIFAVTPQEELRDVYFSGLRKSLIESAEESNIELSFCKNADEVDVEKTDGIIAVGRFLSAELEKMKQLGIQVLFVDSNPDPHEFNSVQPNLQMMVETEAQKEFMRYAFLKEPKTPIGKLVAGAWRKFKEWWDMHRRKEVEEKTRESVLGRLAELKKETSEQPRKPVVTKKQRGLELD